MEKCASPLKYKSLLFTYIKNNTMRKGTMYLKGYDNSRRLDIFRSEGKNKKPTLLKIYQPLRELYPKEILEAAQKEMKIIRTKLKK